MKIKHVKTNKFNINMLQTNKFKTTKIQFTFGNDLSRKTAINRAILPYMMRAINQTYPTRKELATKLEEMYSANFGAGASKLGLSHFIIFDLSVINDKYTLDETSLLEEAFHFLHDILYNPMFSEKIMLEEKRLLEEHFKSTYANKMRYAVKSMHANMYQNQAYQTEPLGSEEDIDMITLDAIQETYHNMMEQDQININIIGDIDFDETESKINTIFGFKERKTTLTLLDESVHETNSVTISESQNVNQAKFVIGYDNGTRYLSDDYYAAIVFNTLLGGSSESLLFKHIREDRSLAYFVNSSYDQNKGTYMIYGGINQQDFDQVYDEIQHILSDIRQGNITDKSFELAKTTIKSAFIESLDSINSLSVRINNLSLFNKELNVKDLLHKIDNVSKEDIVRVASKLQENTVFVLRNDELD